MKNNHKILSLALVSLLCLTLMACGKKEEIAEPVAPEPVETVEVVEEVQEEEPTYDDGLNNVFEVADMNGLTIRYPEDFEVTEYPDQEHTYVFRPINQEDDNAFSSILVSFQESGDFDDYMNNGSELALRACTYLLAESLQNLYGDTIIDYIATEFEDGENYWDLMGLIAIDGGQYEPLSDEPISCASQLRYIGPTGYTIQMDARSLTSHIDEYYELACKMMDTIELDDTWSTMAKEAPDFDSVPEEERIAPISLRTTKTKNNQDTSASLECDPFFWIDEDGDLWYFDGYEFEFVGFGSDFYLEDGELFKAEDAEWDFDDDDFYNPWFLLDELLEDEDDSSLDEIIIDDSADYDDYDYEEDDYDYEDESYDDDYYEDDYEDYDDYQDGDIYYDDSDE